MLGLVPTADFGAEKHPIVFHGNLRCSLYSADFSNVDFKIFSAENSLCILCRKSNMSLTVHGKRVKKKQNMD